MKNNRCLAFIMACITAFSQLLYTVAYADTITESEYGYIFTIIDPEIQLMDYNEDIDAISIGEGIYHADSIDEIQEISKHTQIGKIVKDMPIHLSEEPNDAYYSYQWSISKCDIPAYWDNNITGEGIRIGVIDTGLDLTHEDLASVKVENGINACAFLDGIEDKYYDFSDENGHGTSVASIISATINNEVGMAGITDKCTIVPIRIYDKSSDYSLKVSTLLNAVEYARRAKCDVINISLGFTEPEDELISIVESLINKAVEDDIIIVAASGNKGKEDNDIEYPAQCENVIGVGATTPDNLHAEFSTANESVYISAPGKNILSATLNNKYTYRNGTSFACPIVAAAAIGAKQLFKDIDVSEFKNILCETAVDVDEEGYDMRTGYGVINFEGIYNYIAKPQVIKPTIEPTINPTTEPLTEPDTTEEPICEPTVEPTEEPIIIPTTEPTPTPYIITEPTVTPTVYPTELPTDKPSASPEGVILPTAIPQYTPTPLPTLKPLKTIEPTSTPTLTPVSTEIPSVKPTETPKVLPTEEPIEPTATPTIQPTAEPTQIPEEIPDMETEIKDNDGRTQFIIHNNSGDYIDGTGIVAIYTKRGVLVSMDIMDGIPDKRAIYNINVPKEYIDIKFFVWDNLKSMVPLFQIKGNKYFKILKMTDKTF